MISLAEALSEREFHYNRTYAHNYAMFALHGGQVEPEAEHISYMAAQSVRMALASLGVSR